MTTIRTGGVAAVARLQNGLTPHENLTVKYVTAATVDIDADGLLLFDTNGVAKRFPAVDLTADITASGENGLDTGAEDSETWYAIWAIGKADGTVAALLSESFSAPTLPGGYTYKGFVGAVYNDNSGDFPKFLQNGSTVVLYRLSNIVLSSGDATAYANVALPVIPPNAKFVAIVLGLKTSAGTADVYIRLASGGSGTTPDLDETTFGAPGTGTASFLFPAAEVPIATPQQISYYLIGTNAQADMRVGGWSY